MPRPLRIAVIDDNKDVVTTMTALLESEGHETAGCYSGAEAYACVEEFKPDVVLLDIGLPGKTGWDVARQIRAVHPSRRPMLIAITGQYTKGADKVLSEIVGFDYYLVKPADPNVLLALIEKAR